MDSPITPNLGLNKIDRTSPETTYFDLNKYIDQNAEKVDSFAGGVREEISCLQDRLNNAENEEITLNPGLQVVRSPKDSRFKLGEIKGRTLINLLGNAGDCESLAYWASSNGDAPILDTSIKIFGSSSIHFPQRSQYTSFVYKDIQLRAGAKYIALENVYLQSVTESALLQINLQDSPISAVRKTVTADMSKINLWQTVYVKFSGDLFEASGYKMSYVTGSIGKGTLTANVDAIRVYEISEAEYKEIDSMTADQVEAKYPFVSSGIVGVENPYIIGYGENLLPPFYESWATSGKASMSLKSDYAILLKTVGNDQEFVHIEGFRVIPNTNYTLSVEHNAGVNIHVPGIGPIVSNSTAQLVTFNTGSATSINIGFVNGGLSSGVAGDYFIKNPMLVIGTEAKPFKPQRKSIFALQTELHANPSDGSEPDILFEKEGQYFKLAKWKKLVLDGSLKWLFDQPHTGFKAVVARFDDQVQLSDAVTKYDGKVLKRVTSGEAYHTAPDQSLLNTGINITIPNTDSGWGDSYTPTVDEIKAYFMGWRMCQADTQLYNGTGTRYWGRITEPSNYIGSGVTWTNTVQSVPTSFSGYDSGGRLFAPYQLLFRLAKETVEPVLFEGDLMLPKEQSMVEVGTGIVLRESVVPAKHPSLDAYGVNHPAAYATAILKNKTNNILTVYAGSLPDKRWALWKKVEGANGGAYADVNGYNYDPSKSYTVTYIKLNKSTIQPITGVAAANELAQISYLMESVGATLQSASVAKSGPIAGFMSGSATFTDNDTAQTFKNGFSTKNSLVTVVITSATAPQGTWTVESGDGYFTITSTTAESTDITFDYYIQRAV
ncbi:hypothetical protein [Paenibacillus rhizolycopersici]|uniref:hypothetical protein n=1 Tax=Paenibacillus rhizolycopersici TaxID=2780073 RepID=UPI003D2BB9D0